MTFVMPYVFVMAGVLPHLPAECICDASFTNDHAFTCPHGGYPTLFHNDVLPDMSILSSHMRMGYPVRVWDNSVSHTRMHGPPIWVYAYGTSHTRMGQNTHIGQNNEIRDITAQLMSEVYVWMWPQNQLFSLLLMWKNKKNQPQTSS